MTSPSGQFSGVLDAITETVWPNDAVKLKKATSKPIDMCVNVTDLLRIAAENARIDTTENSMYYLKVPR